MENIQAKINNWWLIFTCDRFSYYNTHIHSLWSYSHNTSPPKEKYNKQKVWMIRFCHYLFIFWDLLGSPKPCNQLSNAKFKFISLLAENMKIVISFSHQELILDPLVWLVWIVWGMVSYFIFVPIIFIFLDLRHSGMHICRLFL